VRRLLDAAPPARGRATPKALIAPHAGYAYSGAVAASAYARLRGGATGIRRVVLIGPAHRAWVNGIAAPGAEAFDTPLGRVPVDTGSLQTLTALPRVRENAAAHAHEHALEVQLPFLQTLCGAFTLVPLLAGAASTAEVAAALDALWGGEETLVVVSSDLSHYHPYAEAQAIDARTVAAIAQGGRDITTDEACGAVPINGLLRCASERGLVPELLDLRNSGDTAGDHSSVVGYAAFAFTP
jgi:AmmeMemoRadiSam system protein B